MCVTSLFILLYYYVYFLLLLNIHLLNIYVVYFLSYCDTNIENDECTARLVSQFLQKRL